MYIDMSVKEQIIFRNNSVIRYIYFEEFWVVKRSGLKGNEILHFEI